VQVGAGGNAGNQASVRVIRGLAVGSITAKNQGRVIRRELTAAIVLSSCLSVIGFLRCVLFKVRGEGQPLRVVGSRVFGPCVAVLSQSALPNTHPLPPPSPLKTPMPETAAITFSLFLVVGISVVLGACLPLGLKKIGVDPAHSSTSIQVGERGAARTRAGRPRLPR
jgi:magnesium transporter